MEAETSLARISHRLERFYNIMQMNRCKVEEEKAELQTRKMPEGKLQELLRASGSQLDKLDFLIQAMVKTSRLETGVIILEKKQALFADITYDGAERYSCFNVPDLYISQAALQDLWWKRIQN